MNEIDISMGFQEEANNIDDLRHYGTPRHSGRYPWGSGKNPQRNKIFIQRADDLQAQGLTEKEIAEAFGMSTGDYRSTRAIYKSQIDQQNQMMAIKLYDKGYSKVAIAKRLGISEGTVRNMLDPTKKRRENTIKGIADHLSEKLKEKPYLDIGEGVERQLNISAEQLHSAELLLKDEGYNVYPYKLPQVNNPKQFTHLKVLCGPDVTKAELKEHLGQVTSPDGLYFENYGEVAVTRKPVPSIDSSRIKINYVEDGGGEKDGVIEIRPGVEDLTLGQRRYAQVRIGVDGTHYLKGMAVYGTDMPPGVDVVFNTNKHKGTPMLGDDESVLKPMKKDPTNPFGSAFRQWSYTDSNGNEVVSPVNIVNDDTDWEGWKKNLSSQFLSKQPRGLAKQQLDLRYGEIKDEYDEIMSITIPTVKRQLLDEFADSCDSAAAHLQAAALPRQGSFAILPISSLKDNEVYAPMYEHGEEVILVRHPHAGTFEIPRLIVNNNNKEGEQVISPLAQHAIGINSHVAQQLSGADYDGDTVLVIPTKGQNLRTRPPLDGLKDFNPTELYKRSPDDPRVTGKTVFNDDGSIKKKGDGFNKGTYMGVASNLITDMSIKGANLDEIERAVKYSMVIIDAEKHNLNWQQAENDFGIAQLKKDYQNGGGASTLISKSKGEVRIPKRKIVYSYSKMTDEEKERYDRGEIIYRDANETYKDPKTGKIKTRMEKITNMESVDDARELSSGYYMEELYAAHANRLKALANEARKASRTTGRLETNKSAKQIYSNEIEEIEKKLARAALEAPKERQAQILATSIINTKVQADPSLNDKDNADKKRKLSAKALNEARDVVNGGEHTKRYRITLSDKEWDAIQAGAISDNKLKTIIRYSDKEELKKRALPRESTGMKGSAKSRARMLLRNGYTIAAVAKELGVSTTTLKKELGDLDLNGGD